MLNAPGQGVFRGFLLMILIIHGHRYEYSNYDGDKKYKNLL